MRPTFLRRKQRSTRNRLCGTSFESRCAFQFFRPWRPPAGKVCVPRRIFPAPLIPGGGRPPPPQELSARERDIWTDAVQSRPLYYFDAPTLPLLAAFCTHATIVEE